MGFGLVQTGKDAAGPGDELLEPGGGYSVLRAPVGGPSLPGGKSWGRIPSAQPWESATAGQGLTIPAGIGSVVETDPQNLFALLKSASTVDRQGSASGDGWTGTSYAFTVRITFDPAGSSPAVTAVGTVGVDQQGRVRRLDAAYTVPAQASAPPQRVTVEMTFSDFGTPVSVSPRRPVRSSSRPTSQHSPACRNRPSPQPIRNAEMAAVRESQD